MSTPSLMSQKKINSHDLQTTSQSGHHQHQLQQQHYHAHQREILYNNDSISSHHEVPPTPYRAKTLGTNAKDEIVFVREEVKEMLLGSVDHHSNGQSDSYIHANESKRTPDMDQDAFRHHHQKQNDNLNLFKHSSTINSVSSTLSSDSTSSSSSLLLNPPRYDELGILGKGAFSKVHLVQVSKLGNQPFALKVIDSAFSSENHREEVLNEYRILSTLSSKYVPYLYMAWQADLHLYMLFDYCEKGTLHDLHQMCRKDNGEGFSVNEIWCFMHDACSALAYVHSKNIIHNDVKPTNMFLKNDHLILGDFGNALVFKQGEKYLGGEDGDRIYISLEALNGLKSTKSDMFSLGLSMFQISTNVDLEKDDKMREKVKNGEFNDFKREFSAYPAKLSGIIFNLLDKESEIRKSADSLIKGEKELQSPSRKELEQRLSKVEPKIDIDKPRPQLKASPSFSMISSEFSDFSNGMSSASTAAATTSKKYQHDRNPHLTANSTATASTAATSYSSISTKAVTPRKIVFEDEEMKAKVQSPEPRKLNFDEDS